MADARKFDRFAMPLSTRITLVDDGTEKDCLYFVTADVCAGGAFFQTRRALPEGTDVDLEMAVPLTRFRSIGNSLRRVFIRIRGTVLRTTETGMAIRFKGQHRFCRHAA